MILRKIFISSFIVCSILAFSYSSSLGTEEKTLGEIRKELLKKEVIITGNKAPDFYSRHQVGDVFDHWHLAEGDNQKGYKIKRGNIFNSYAPYKLKGARATIESIEIRDSAFRKKRTATDLFGENIKEEDIERPYFDLVVKLPDGTLLTTAGYYSTIIGGNIQLASEVDKLKNEISQNIDKIIGKVIYSVEYSKVFPPDITLDDILDYRQRIILQLDIPNLSSLTIENVKFLETEYAVILKVKFQDKKLGVIFTKFEKDGSKELTLFEKIVSGFLTKIPKSLTQREVAAIKKSKIFVGMSETALYYSWGYPDKINKWGRGGEQLIYGDCQFVYIKNKKIIDWQTLQCLLTRVQYG